MSDQEMKDIWLSGKDGDRIILDLPQLMINLKVKVKKMDRTLFFRDFREIIAAVFVMCFFSYKSITDSGTIEKITSAMFVAWAGYVIYRLLDVRKYKKAVNVSHPFKSQLLQEKIYLEQQAHLLDSILSWYVGPFAVIMTLRVISDSYSDPLWVFVTSALIMLVFVGLLSWGIYALNKKAAKTAYQPLIENIDRVLLQLDE